MPPDALSDHDLLIKLTVIIERIEKDIRELKDGTTRQIDDHEKRIRDIEKQKWAFAGAVTAISTAVSWGLITFVR